jgi:hypothetical protein
MFAVGAELFRGDANSRFRSFAKSWYSAFVKY